MSDQRGTSADYLGPPAPTSHDDLRPKRPYSGWAIAALVTGLVPIAGIAAAIPLAIVALVKISRTRERGTWLAVTGMVISGVWWVGLLGLTSWVATTPAHRNDAGVITESGRLDLSEIRRGDCVSISGLTEGDPTQTLGITGVPCVEGHNAQALFIVVFPDVSYPGEEAIQQQTRLECASHYAEARINEVDQFLMFPFEKRWSESGGHRAICFITNGGGRMTGSSLH